MHSRIMRGYEHAIRSRKEDLFADLPTGTIVEIGPGVGANFPFLPAGCSWLGYEPNGFMHKELQEVAGRYDEIEVEVCSDRAESLPRDSNSVDAVIGTLVLCSVGDPHACIAEILRILKPGGRYFFIEHVAARSGSWRRLMQSLAFYPWRFVADGCCTNRELGGAIQNSGFDSIKMESFSVTSPPMPPFLTPHICGWAMK